MVRMPLATQEPRFPTGGCVLRCLLCVEKPQVSPPSSTASSGCMEGRSDSTGLPPLLPEKKPRGVLCGQGLEGMWPKTEPQTTWVGCSQF